MSTQPNNADTFALILLVHLQLVSSLLWLNNVNIYRRLFVSVKIRPLTLWMALLRLKSSRVTGLYECEVSGVCLVGLWRHHWGFPSRGFVGRCLSGWVFPKVTRAETPVGLHIKGRLLMFSFNEHWYVPTNLNKTFSISGFRVVTCSRWIDERTDRHGKDNWHICLQLCCKRA